MIIDTLARLGLWPEMPDALASYHIAPIPNTRGIRVGEVRSVLWS